MLTTMFRSSQQHYSSKVVLSSPVVVVQKTSEKTLPNNVSALTSFNDDDEEKEDVEEGIEIDDIIIQNISSISDEFSIDNKSFSPPPLSSSSSSSSNLSSSPSSSSSVSIFTTSKSTTDEEKTNSETHTKKDDDEKEGGDDDERRSCSPSRCSPSSPSPSRIIATSTTSSSTPLRQNITTTLMTMATTSTNNNNASNNRDSSSNNNNNNTTTNKIVGMKRCLSMAGQMIHQEKILNLGDRVATATDDDNYDTYDNEEEEEDDDDDYDVELLEGDFDSLVEEEGSNHRQQNLSDVLKGVMFVMTFIPGLQEEFKDWELGLDDDDDHTNFVSFKSGDEDTTTSFNGTISFEGGEEEEDEENSILFYPPHDHTVNKSNKVDGDDDDHDDDSFFDINNKFIHDDLDDDEASKSSSNLVLVDEKVLEFTFSVSDEPDIVTMEEQVNNRVDLTKLPDFLHQELQSRRDLDEQQNHTVDALNDDIITYGDYEGSSSISNADNKEGEMTMLSKTTTMATTTTTTTNTPAPIVVTLSDVEEEEEVEEKEENMKDTTPSIKTTSAAESSPSSSSSATAAENDEEEIQDTTISIDEGLISISNEEEEAKDGDNTSTNDIPWDEQQDIDITNDVGALVVKHDEEMTMKSTTWTTTTTADLENHYNEEEGDKKIKLQDNKIDFPRESIQTTTGKSLSPAPSCEEEEEEKMSLDLTISIDEGVISEKMAQTTTPNTATTNNCVEKKGNDMNDDDDEIVEPGSRMDETQEDVSCVRAAVEVNGSLPSMDYNSGLQDVPILSSSEVEELVEKSKGETYRENQLDENDKHQSSGEKMKSEELTELLNAIERKRRELNELSNAIALKKKQREDRAAFAKTLLEQDEAPPVRKHKTINFASGEVEYVATHSETSTSTTGDDVEDEKLIENTSYGTNSTYSVVAATATGGDNKLDKRRTIKGNGVEKDAYLLYCLELHEKHLAGQKLSNGEKLDLQTFLVEQAKAENQAKFQKENLSTFSARASLWASRAQWNFFGAKADDDGRSGAWLSQYPPCLGFNVDDPEPGIVPFEADEAWEELKSEIIVEEPKKFEAPPTSEPPAAALADELENADEMETGEATYVQAQSRTINFASGEVVPTTTQLNTSALTEDDEEENTAHFHGLKGPGSTWSTESVENAKEVKDTPATEREGGIAKIDDESTTSKATVGSNRTSDCSLPRRRQNRIFPRLTVRKMQSKPSSSPGNDEDNKENTASGAVSAPANKTEDVQEVVKLPRRYRLLSSPGNDEDKENTADEAVAAPANKRENIQEVKQPRRYRLLSRRNRFFARKIQSKTPSSSGFDDNEKESSSDGGAVVVATSKAEHIPAVKPSRQERPFAVKIHVQSKASPSAPEATCCDEEKDDIIGNGGLVSRATERSGLQPLGRKLSRLKRLKRLRRGNWGSG